MADAMRLAAPGTETGAFLMMEASGLGGATATMVLIPGLLGAGIGSLVFLGLDSWTGFGTFSLEVPKIPPAASPTAAEFLWAVAIGVLFFATMAALIAIFSA